MRRRHCPYHPIHYSSKAQQSIYIFGGSHGQCFNSFARKSCLKDREWVTLARLPNAARYTNGIKIDNILILTGYELNGVYAYDSRADTYELICETERGAKYLIKGRKHDIFLVHSAVKGIYRPEMGSLNSWAK